MRLDRAWIQSHVPHSGSMCLLDEVLEWDAHRIVCRSASHRAAENPLRARNRLSSVCGVEYAAQAMAVHGALLAPPNDLSAPPAAPKAGYLTSLRSVHLYGERLDDKSADLIAVAQLLSGDARSILYEFTVSCGNDPLLEGRATVILDTARWQGVPAAGRPA